MHTFVINLKRSTERRAHMEKQLAALNLSYEIIEATDGSTLSEADLAVLYDKEASLKHLYKPITKNEIACADSHLRIYEKMVKENIPYALILEDDVTLDPRITNILSPEFFANRKFDWLQVDYARVGWPFLESWLKASWLRIKLKPMFFFYALAKLPFITTLSIFEWLRQNANSKIRIVKFMRPLYLTGAYIITLEGAIKLLNFGRPIQFSSDMLPNKIDPKAGFVMLAVCPQIAHQDSFFKSEIGSR